MGLPVAPSLWSHGQPPFPGTDMRQHARSAWEAYLGLGVQGLYWASQSAAHVAELSLKPFASGG